MDYLMTILGLIGSACCVSMFLMLQQDKIKENSIKFYAINGIGSFLILVGSAYEFDSGDLGTISLEFIWTIISVMGVYKVMKKAKENA